MAKISRKADVKNELPERGYNFNEEANETISRGAKQSPGWTAKNSTQEHTTNAGPPGPFGSGYTGKTGRSGGSK